MHFTQALTVALSLSAAAVHAAPAPIVKGSADGSSKLMLRSVHESQIAARGVGIHDAVSSKPLQARGLDSVAHLRRAIDLRFGDVRPEARELAMVTELHRRGLLDQLVAALRDLIITLLGKGGGMTRRQSSNTEQLEQAIHQVTCILDALFGNTDETCSDVLGGAANSTATNATSAANVTGASTNRTLSPLEKKLSALGAELRNGTSITQMVDNMMSHNATAAPSKKKGDKKKGSKGDKDKSPSAKNATSIASSESPASSVTTTATTAAQQEKRSVELLQARQNSGLEGLLVALRDVVDTILNTLLPMASRGEDDSSATSTSSGRWPPQDCPPPTPNDGMYRPGCPGYGRRDLAVRRSMNALGERDADILQSVLPMIEMLLRQLPSLIQSFSSSPSSPSSAGAAAATATSVTGSAKSASPTSMVDDAFAQIISALGSGSNAPSSSGSKTASSAAGSAAKAQATGAASDGANGASSAARSAANLSQNFARDLLNGDGMNLGKRQSDSTTTDGVDGIGNDNCEASGNSGGVNVSLLNNLLNGLLSGFSRRSEDAVPLEFFKRQTDGTTTDGGVISSGNCNASNNTGGINLSLLDNLLNGLLSGFSRRDMGAEDGMVSVEALQRDVGADPLSARTAPESTMPLQARADFAPVWEQLKKIGNDHFHSARDLGHTDDEVTAASSAAKRAVGDDDAPNFTPVWEAIRDLVDSGYQQAATNSADDSAAAQRRDANAPLKLDYKPLMKAGIKYGKQLFKSFTSSNGHAKRSTDYKPLINAASSFAATAIKEMFKSS